MHLITNSMYCTTPLAYYPTLNENVSSYTRIIAWDRHTCSSVYTEPSFLMLDPLFSLILSFICFSCNVIPHITANHRFCALLAIQCSFYHHKCDTWLYTLSLLPSYNNSSISLALNLSALLVPITYKTNFVTYISINNNH